MNPAISIMMPTFARREGGYLERAIKSVLAQTLGEFEFLIVDDGSTDGSADVIYNFTRLDSRVRHVRFEQNVGLPALTLGLAYAQASADKIAFIFDDCTIVPHHLEKLAGTLDANPNTLMAYGQAEATWMNGESLTIGSAYDPTNMLKGNNHIPNVSVMLRRKAIETVGWYDPHVLLKRFCDWDLWVRIGTHCTPIFVPEVLAYESGTTLRDSLGEKVTVLPDLMLRYSRTERSRLLQPDFLSSYDPFRTDIQFPLSAQDRTDLDFLLVEHFLSIGNREALLARFGHDIPGSDDTKIELLRARYLSRRVDTLTIERNQMQHALLSTHHNAPLATRISELEAILDTERKTSATTKLEHQAEIAARDEQLRLLLSSTSWRITRPLRALKRPRNTLRRLVASLRFRLGRHRILTPTPADSDVGAIDLRYPNQSKPLRVLAIGDATTSTELCVHWPLEYMAEHLGIEYRFYDVQSLPVAPSALQRADILLLMRCFTPECVALAHEAKRSGVSVVYMTDDDFESLIESEPGSPALAGLIEHLRTINAAENIREIASFAEAVVVFSEELRQRFARIAKTFLVPAMAGVEFYDRLPNQSRPNDQQSEIRVGYSGSLTHDRDVALVVPSLKTLLDRHAPNLVIESIGQRIDGLVDHPRYRHFDHVVGLPAFSALQHGRSWDIGLAPLEVTPFNKAKTDNKFRSYGAAGIPAVYTNIPHFAASIRDGETGLLVDNNEESWTKAIDRLIEDRRFRLDIASNARDDVRARFGIEAIAFLYRRFLGEAARGVKILVVGHLHIATLHIDVRIPFAELQRRGVIRYRMREPEDTTDPDFDWAEVLVIVRACEPHIADKVKRAQQKGVKVIYSWDDDFFSIPTEHSDLHAYYNSPEVRSTLEYVLANADLVKASTPQLADVSRRYTDKIVTASYGFDMSLLPKDLAFRNDGRIRIGYFGSLGRGSEFNCVMEALRRICKDCPEVDVEFFGYLPADVDDFPRLKHLAFTDDYESSVRILADRQWDIGLAPLAINDLNRAKLPTKYRDYGAVRAAGIYTDIETYRTAVRDGATGLLTENTSDGWYRCIDTLIRNPTLRTSIADAAFTDIAQNYNLDVALNAWADTLRRIGFAIPRSD